MIKMLKGKHLKATNNIFEMSECNRVLLSKLILSVVFIMLRDIKSTEQANQIVLKIHHYLQEQTYWVKQYSATAMDAAPIEGLIGDIGALVPASANVCVPKNAQCMAREMQDLIRDVRGLLNQVEEELTTRATPKKVLESFQKHEDRGWAELLELLDNQATAISAGQGQG